MAKKKLTAGIVPMEPISLAELARRAHVSRQAAAQWVKIQNEEGADLFVDDETPGKAGRRSRMVNALNPLVDGYVNDPLDRARDRDARAAAGGSKSRYTAQKLLEFARGLEIKNREIRGRYISRDFTFLYFDTELQFAKKHMRSYSAQVCRTIEKELFAKAVTKEQKKMLAKFREDIDKELQSVYISLDRCVQDLKENNDIKYETIAEAANAPAGY
jgi:hypothetical protein